MSDIIKIFEAGFADRRGQLSRRPANECRQAEKPVTSYGVFKPVIRSAVGIVRESAGLVVNIAELGVTLISETGANHPPRPSSPKAFPRHGNVIPFPQKNQRNGN